MIYILINVLPIFAATLAGLLAGYGYRALAGGGSPPTRAYWVTAFLAEFWLAAILAGALILAPVKANPWTVAIGTAIIIWIGFVVPATIVTLTGRGVKLGDAFDQCAFWLVVMLVQASVLHMIGLAKPV